MKMHDFGTAIRREFIANGFRTQDRYEAQRARCKALLGSRYLLHPANMVKRKGA